MANILSTQVLKVLDIPQKFYLANELYVGSSLLLDTETEEMILAQYSQNPDVYAELFRIGGGGLTYSWRMQGVELLAGDYTEEPFSKGFDFYITVGGYICNSLKYPVQVNPAAPVISDIQLSPGLNNVALNVISDGVEGDFLDLDGNVPNDWIIEVTFSGTYVYVLGQINWIKFKVDGKECIQGVIITES